MAEAVVFSLASKILSVVASPALQIAYEKGVSIWEAKDELTKLQVSVETIHAVLLDAEKKQEGSVAVKNWIKRLKSVLYDAEDLFDEFATEDLIKKQMMEGKIKLSLKNKVRVSCWVSCSKLNPIVSRNSIAKKVKAIRKNLIEISIDMAQFQFVRCPDEKPVYNMGRGEDRGVFVDAKSVFGRDVDKKIMLEMLINGSDSARSDNPIVLAIVGIGGMGKTTLAQLIFNDEKIRSTFQKRWFACISDISDEREVLGKIFQSIKGVSYSDLNVGQLQTKIRESVENQKCLLILDDVWEEDHARWQDRISLLNGSAAKSRILVTTRLPLVAEAVGALRYHKVEGLSEYDAWSLFKKSAFREGYENDTRRESLGKHILKKCSGVPLAIRSIGSLLYLKNTIVEWEAIASEDLPVLQRKHNDETLRVLKLSYDHLPSNLKQCFTYCCLFPKDYIYNRLELIHHWIAQRYIDFDEEESSFMHLLRMGFFQDVNEDMLGDIKSCKMHDIMHDLALYLIGEEGEFGTSLNMSSSTRHVSLIVDGDESGSWDIPPSLLNIKSIRSCMLRGLSLWHSQPNLDQLCSNFKRLRTLTLSHLGIEHIPPSIGELKLVKYLDLSWNTFEWLPNSMANLVNLLVLNLKGCRNLKVWPRNFKNLIKLRFLKLGKKIYSMPEGIEGMDNLQYLSSFMVENWSKVDGLNKLLERVRGNLFIMFDIEMEVEHEGRWQLPATTSLQDLEISSYPGHGIRGWRNNESGIKIERLRLENCENVKFLPSMSCLPVLKFLCLKNLPELEFVEEEEEVNTHNPATSQKFFPCLKKLELEDLPKLKGWRGKVAAEATSTSSKSGFPGKSLASLEHLFIRRCSSLTSLHLASPCLRIIGIHECNELMSIDLDQIQALRYLRIKICNQLKRLHIEAHLIPDMEEIEIKYCPELSFSVQQGLSQSVDSLLLERSPSSLSFLSLKKIDIRYFKWPISLRCLELTSLEICYVSDIDGLQSLHIPSPNLQRVYLNNCVGLTSVEVEAPTEININSCCELKNFCIAHPVVVQSLSIDSPSSVDWGSISNLSECSCLTKLYLFCVDGGFIERLLSSPASSSSPPSEGEMSIFKSTGSLTVALTSLKEFYIKDVHGLKSLIIKSPHLMYIHISNCNELTSVELESPLTIVTLQFCAQLKNVRIPRPIAPEALAINECPELSLNTGVDWDALTNLSNLELYLFPPPDEIPDCLLQRQALGNLQIIQGIRSSDSDSCLDSYSDSDSDSNSDLDSDTEL